jgi:hypothetical protein
MLTLRRQRLEEYELENSLGYEIPFQKKRIRVVLGKKKFWSPDFKRLSCTIKVGHCDYLCLTW